MSASNWAVCPRCAKQREEKVTTMRREIESNYGVIPLAQHDALRRQLTEFENAKHEATLREDYEFCGAEDGTVIAEYRCSCTKCGLESDFTHRHELDV